jgi:hypothetical protein
MNANTNKNREYDQKQSARVRPTTPSYDFTDLERVMHVWVTGTVSKSQEIYSPYLGAL